MREARQEEIEYVTTGADMFYYYEDPIVTTLDPPLGPKTGSTQITLIGTGFLETQDSSAVRFRDTNGGTSHVGAEKGKNACW